MKFDWRFAVIIAVITFVFTMCNLAVNEYAEKLMEEDRVNIIVETLESEHFEEIDGGAE